MKSLTFRFKGHDGKPCYTTIELPDDAALLVAHAKDGAEVYEGDVVHFTHDGTRYEYKAQLTPCAVADNGCYIGADQIATREVEARL